jgi:hypothetical protein
MKSFFVDQASFATLTHTNLEAAVRSFCDYTAWLHGQELSDLGLQTEKSSQFLYSEVFSSMTLADLLYTENSPLPKDLRQRLSTAINRSVNWDADVPNPTVQELEFNNGIVVSDPTLTRSFELAEARTPNSCVPVDTGTRPSGWSSLTRRTDRAIADIHFGTNQADFLVYLRKAMKIAQVPSQDFLKIGRFAFPNLVFHPDLTNQFRRFSRDYHTILPEVIKALAGINDHFAAISRVVQGVPGEISARFSATCEFECTPESVSTRRNGSAMARRNVSYAGKVYCCEWHAKLLPTVDRIHFYPAFEGDKILIGIFIDHLPT